MDYSSPLVNVPSDIIKQQKVNMTSTTYQNETLKRKFYEYLKTSRGFSDESIERYENSIWLWEDFTKNADFGLFNMTRAKEFQDWLKNKKVKNSDRTITLSYCYDNLRHLQVFFEWLSEQPNYKSKINKTAIANLNLSMKEKRIATQPRNIEFPTFTEIKTVIENIGNETEVEMRDRALFSLAALTGARITAMRTLPMKSFNKKESIIYQDPTLGVETKFAEKITSVLIPFGYEKALKYFIEWFDYLEKEKEFKPTDPIFPATKISNGEENVNYYSTGEVEPKFLKTSTSLRKIFEKRFKQAGIGYYNPHAFRHFWVREISKLPLTEEEKKAISQNLGHKDVGTTFGSYGYGKIEENRQIEIIKNIDFVGRKKEVKFSLDEEDLKQLAKLIKEGENPKI